MIARGVYRQVGGDRASDFLPGGYVTGTIDIRADGVLEVTRTYDRAGEVSVTWRVAYEWNEDRTELVLGRDEQGRPPAGTLRGFAIPDAGVRATPASMPFPVTLAYEPLTDGRIRLGAKRYAPATD